MNSKPKYLGIRVARLILTGDVDLARKEAMARTRGGTFIVGETSYRSSVTPLTVTWMVAEARAIIGACKVAQSRGWPVFAAEFGL
jgi:hypothetical protein